MTGGGGAGRRGWGRRLGDAGDVSLLATAADRWERNGASSGVWATSIVWVLYGPSPIWLTGQPNQKPLAIASCNFRLCLVPPLKFSPCHIVCLDTCIEY